MIIPVPEQQHHTETHTHEPGDMSMHMICSSAFRCLSPCACEHTRNSIVVRFSVCLRARVQIARSFWNIFSSALHVFTFSIYSCVWRCRATFSIAGAPTTWLRFATWLQLFMSFCAHAHLHRDTQHRRRDNCNTRWIIVCCSMWRIATTKTTHSTERIHPNRTVIKPPLACWYCQTLNLIAQTTASPPLIPMHRIIISHIGEPFLSATCITHRQLYTQVVCPHSQSIDSNRLQTATRECYAVLIPPRSIDGCVGLFTVSIALWKHPQKK